MTASRRPTRATVECRAYLDLQNLARRQHRPTDELHQLYALEGFLARLAALSQADQLVLKGGVLLAAYDARRPTRDVDMQARAIAGERNEGGARGRAVGGLLVATIGPSSVFVLDACSYLVHVSATRSAWSSA